jgi:hypothetical protein
LHWLNIEKRIIFKILFTIFKCLNDSAPQLLSELVSPCQTLSRNSQNTLTPLFYQSKYGRRAFSYHGPRLWNCLPLNIRSACSLSSFKSQLKTYLFTSFDTHKSQYCKYARLLL